MKIKKLISVVLAILLCFGSMSIVASAEATEGDSDFVDTPTLPTVEAVEVFSVFRPLRSFISVVGFGPLFDGTVLKITYPDGQTEMVTIETNWTGLSDYVAGDFNVYTYYYDTMKIKTLGINKKKIILNGLKNGVEYEGICDLTYLYIPSPVEFVYMIDSLVPILF